MLMWAFVDFGSGQNGGMHIVPLAYSDEGVRKGYKLVVVERGCPDVGLDQNVGLVKRGLKRCRGKRWSKVNWVHGVTMSFSEDDSVQDSKFENKNCIILNEAVDAVNDCRSLGFSFKEAEAHVVDGMCNLIKGE